MNRDRLLGYATRTLPYASRPDVVAGYVVAGAMFPVFVVWAVIVSISIASLTVDRTSSLVYGGVGTSVVVLGLLLAVLIGASTWNRHVDPRATGRRGAVVGAYVALCSLFTSALVVGAGLGLAIVHFDSTVPTLGEYAVGAALGAGGLTFGGLATAGWLLVPAGAYAGWSYQRERREQLVAPARERAVE